MKKVILLWCLTLSLTTMAQKIQLKKDKVLWDKVEVATVKEPYRDHLEIGTLSGEKRFTVAYKGLNANEMQMYNWLEITSADGKQKTEIPYEVLITAFNSDRIIVHLLAVKYNLINEKGINEDALKTFFDTPRESLSEKYGKIVASAKFEADEQKRKVQQVKSSLNPQIKADNSITMSLNGRLTIVGSIQAKPYVVGNGVNQYVTVYDLDGIPVARLSNTAMDFYKYRIETYDGKNYDFYIKSQYNNTNSTFLYEFLCDLVSRGYMLNHQAKMEQQQLQQAKINLAKERSVNIYQKPGYLIDEEGVKYTGILSINFQMLDVNQTGQVLPENTADRFGKTVSITYKNDKNQERTKSFKANSGAYFCIQEQGQETFYYGMAVKGDSMKKLQNMGNLSFDNAYFYQLINKEDSILVLQDPVETDRYVIKIKSESKGQMIDRRDTEELAPVLADYLKACPATATSIRKGEMDLKIERNLITIAKEYQACKK